MTFVENFQRNGQGIARIVGLDRLGKRSSAEAGLRVSPPILGPERARALAELARISLSSTSPEDPDPIAYLEQISMTYLEPTTEQDDQAITAALVRAWRHLAHDTRAVLTFLRDVGIGGDAEIPTSAHDLDWLSLSRIERGNSQSELERLSLSRFAGPAH